MFLIKIREPNHTDKITMSIGSLIDTIYYIKNREKFRKIALKGNIFFKKNYYILRDMLLTAEETEYLLHIFIYAISLCFYIHIFISIFLNDYSSNKEINNVFYYLAA